MNKQEVFDKVSTHLLTQKQKSIDEDGCLYFNSTNGFTCAVGCLIPKEKYNPSLEGKEIESEEIKEILLSEGIKCFNLLSELQVIHDKRNPQEWQSRLGCVATFFGLSKHFLAVD